MWTISFDPSNRSLNYVEVSDNGMVYCESFDKRNKLQAFYLWRQQW